MRKSTPLAPALGLLLLLSGCASHDHDTASQAEGKKLSGRQVREVVNGSSVRLEGYGQEATVDFSGDGTMNGSNTSGEKDKGEWQVKGDTLCLRFEKWGEGDSICYQVEGGGSDYQLFNRKGMMVYDLTVITPGAPATAVQTPRPAPSPTPRGEAPPPRSSGPGLDPARELFPPSPQAEADVEYIIRQSAKNCPGCNLAQAQLSGQDLMGANLQGANLTEADLSHANLRRANLRGANLYRANLRQADLAGADLTGANLTEALR